MSNVALGPESVSADVPVPLEPDAPVLAMPDGWVIDDLARERLARQLTRAPRHFEGVVAESGPLPCGASYRVHAERLCLRPLSDAAETSRDELEGAVLLRPGVAFKTRNGGVQVHGKLLVDPGAHVHDPWRPPGPIEAASRLGRLPFPRRPVVVFLACEPDVEVLDWARSLVNNLVRRDVEGRLAMLEISEGLHLTQPCLPSEESIRTLKPDVIVALDRKQDFDTAREFAQDVARVLANRHPKRLTVEPRKNKRRGRLYLDTARNSYAQHAVAPYAVRAIEGAPIATPLSWEEVNDSKVDAQRFTVKNIFQRLSRKSDPWKNLRRSMRSFKTARRRLDGIIKKEQEKR